MTQTTTEGDVLKFISFSIASMMLIVDVVTVFGLGFDYILPVLLAFPHLELVETLISLGVLAFLLFIQVLFLPLIAFLFDFPSDQL